VKTTIPSALTRRLLAALAASLLGSTVLLAAPVRAQESPSDPPADTPETSDPGFSVQPSGPDGPGDRDWFTYTLDPGAVFGDTVAISNLSDRRIRFVIYPTDAISVEDTAGFAALKDTDAPVDVGTWIELAANEYTVDPGKRIDVPFSVTVPEDAEPGDHAGAILAIDGDAVIDPSTALYGVTFDVRHRLGARVYVRVGGAVDPDLRIDDLSVTREGGHATVNWEVSNSGNLRLAPTAEVRITGWFGRTVATAPVQQVPELLPGANYVGASIVDGLSSYEPLTAHLVVRAEGVETERSEQFAGYPWLLIALVLLVVVVALWWYRRRRRRRRPPAGPPPSRSSARVSVSA